MLPTTVARSFSDGVAIRYVRPVLWMTSCLHIIACIGDTRKAHAFQRASTGGDADLTLLRIHKLTHHGPAPDRLSCWMVHFQAVPSRACHIMQLQISTLVTVEWSHEVIVTCSLRCFADCKRRGPMLQTCDWSYFGRCYAFTLPHALWSNVQRRVLFAFCAGIHFVLCVHTQAYVPNERVRSCVIYILGTARIA